MGGGGWEWDGEREGNGCSLKAGKGHFWEDQGSPITQMGN